MNISFGKKSNTVILCIIILIMVFQTALQNSLPFFGYFDEFIAFFGILVFALNIKTVLYFKRVLIPFSIVIVLGILSSVIYKNQLFNVALLDLFLNMKFILSIILGFYLSAVYNSNTLKKLLKVVISIMFILSIITSIFHIFPVYEQRFGISSLQLFYAHPTYLAASCVFLISLFCMQKKEKYDEIYIFACLIMLVLTLRIKAIVSGIVFFFFYFVFDGKVKKRYIIYIAILGVLIGKGAFNYFFVENTGSARNMLLIKSFSVASDYFPLGSGFATYASFYSGKYYSALYSKYGLDSTWGITKDYYAFISDSFWPMILAQTGYFGLSAYVVYVYKMFIFVVSKLKMTRYIYSAVFPLLYLCIISLAESAFVNPIAVPLGFCIGLCLKRRVYDV